MVISTALAAAKRTAVESLYTGIMTVRVMQKTTDPDTGITSMTRAAVITNAACRISYQYAAAASSDEAPAGVNKNITLLCAPELDLPAGSTITVVQNGHTVDYKRSGVTEVYSDHQSIPLVVSEDYA